MYKLIKSSGLFLLLLYCFFNLGNVLYFQVSVSFVGLLLLAVACTYFVQRIARASVNNLSISFVEVMAFCLMGLGFVVLGLQRVLYETHIGFDGIDTQQALMSLWIVSVLWILIGGSVSAAPIKESPLLAILIGGGVTAAMGFGVDSELFKSFTIEGLENDSSSVSHLTVERYIVIPIILAYALSPKTRWLVALGGIYCLFLLGGRTALFVFIITVVLMNITGNSVRNIIALIVLGAVLFFSLRYAVDNGILDPDNRQVRDILFLGGVSEDNSYNARVQILQESLQDLPQQFLFGNFSLTVERFGKFGAYIHNLLSAWQFYGFFMFSAIVTALIYSVGRMFGTAGRRRSPITVFSSFVLVYVVISLAVGKYAGWSMLWFALGLWMLRPESSNSSVANSRGRSQRTDKRRRRSSPSMLLSAT